MRRLFFLMCIVLCGCSMLQRPKTPVVQPVAKKDRGKYLGCEIVCTIDGMPGRHLLKAPDFEEHRCLENAVLECVMRAVYEKDLFYKISPEIPTPSSGQKL